MIARFQLARSGVTGDQIRWRVARGDLHRVHRGVYAVGHARLSHYGAAWAAVLACTPRRSDRSRARSPRAAVAGWSAVAMLGLGPWPSRPQIVVRGAARDLRGVVVRTTRSLPEGDLVADPAGLRCTQLPRTLLDLSAGASVGELQRVLSAAEGRRRLDVDAIEAVTATAPGHVGVARLRRALEPWTTIPEAEYRSLLERFCAMVLHGGGLGEHEVNGTLTLGNGREVTIDIVFRDKRLAVEIDGRTSHERAVQFAADKERDRELQKLGWDVLRFTWQDVRDRPSMVLADIRAVLARR